MLQKAGKKLIYEKKKLIATLQPTFTRLAARFSKLILLYSQRVGSCPRTWQDRLSNWMTVRWKGIKESGRTASQG
jgi:hypothetical protein